MHLTANLTSNQPIWAIVPAAGRGKRMQNTLPKQYIAIAGKPVLQWTLEALLRHHLVQGVIVGAAQSDDQCRNLAAELTKQFNKTVYVCEGGVERAHTVFNALQFLHDNVTAHAFVLVHDAARPCISLAEMNQVIDAGMGHADGAILALPVADTLKRERQGHSIETVERKLLWRAQTPQFFRADLLSNALQSALHDNNIPTDEAQAMEWQGHYAKLVAGSANNIKLTYEQDIDTITRFLEMQHD